MAIFPNEPGLADCPLNSPSPFIPGLCILLGQTFHVILNAITPGLFRASSLSNSLNFPCYTTFDPVIIRDVRNRFFNFGSVLVLGKNSDSVRNEFGSVRFAKTRFGSDSYLLLM